MMNSPIECDYLIIGGGTAGCIVAHRLASDADNSVILLEAGKSDEYNISTNCLSALDQQDESYDWGYHATPIANSTELLAYARARILGGCANHNDCAFLTPPASDFKDWVAAGATGWTWQALIPAISRVNERLGIESSPIGNVLGQAFIDANVELGTLQNNFRESIRQGAGWFPLNSIGDIRQSSSVAYLHPLQQQPGNLSVHTEVEVEKLTIENRTVVGAQSGQQTYLARCEVILCCGSINTPKLLMLSGIGPAGELHNLAIPVHNDLPGVGKNLMDHAAANVVYSLKKPAPAWQRTPCEATAMIDLEPQGGPDILYHFVPYLREKYAQPRFTGINHGIKIAPNVTRPLSRGELLLNSADVADAPIINLNYFSDSDDHDMRLMLGGLRYARRLGQTEALKNWLNEEVLPGKSMSSYTDLAEYVRSNCETVYHPAGTCKMGSSNDPQAVLDANLKVKGVDRLRVVDAAVFPTMVTVNICNMVMIVAEHAAELIKAENK
ncbi:MAG: choline oxidase [Parasphingorhabdus sp.]|jgi:choline oxidase